MEHFVARFGKEKGGCKEMKEAKEDRAMSMKDGKAEMTGKWREERSLLSAHARQRQPSANIVTFRFRFRFQILLKIVARRLKINKIAPD